MQLRFNVDSDKHLKDVFLRELACVKQLMEKTDNIFYLNVRFSRDEMEAVDLTKIATIYVCGDGIGLYSLDTNSSSFIYFDKLVGLELVEMESKKNE